MYLEKRKKSGHMTFSDKGLTKLAPNYAVVSTSDAGAQIEEEIREEERIEVGESVSKASEVSETRENAGVGDEVAENMGGDDDGDEEFGVKVPNRHATV
jgi:hypothetical protein